MTRRRAGRRFGAPSPEPMVKAGPLRLQRPADVLAAIPFLVGYHPRDSMVVLGLRQRLQVFAARCDLPAADAPLDQVRAQVDYLLGVILRQDVNGVMLVGLGPEARVAPLTQELGLAFTAIGLPVQEAMRAEDGRFWSYLCTDNECCPPGGVAYDPVGARVAAECTLAGMVALPDRETYEAQVSPVGGLARAAMRRASIEADDRLFTMLTHPPDEGTVHALLASTGLEAIMNAEDRQRRGIRLTDDEVAWIAILLTSTPIRDVAWARITGPLAELRLHRTLWMDVMRRCQPDVSPGPSCLFAFAAWRCGEGTLACLALDRVLDQDPAYSLAELLHDLITAGLPPSALKDFPWRGVTGQSARRARRRSSSRRTGSRRG